MLAANIKINILLLLLFKKKYVCKQVLKDTVIIKIQIN